MKNEDLINLGFKPIPHFTIGNAVILEFGRNRYLSASDVGNPNEMVWICQSEDEAHKKVTDLICIHNYDYDGFLTLEKIKLLIGGLRNEK